MSSTCREVGKNNSLNKVKIIHSISVTPRPLTDTCLAPAETGREMKKKSDEKKVRRKKSFFSCSTNAHSKRGHASIAGLFASYSRALLLIVRLFGS